MTFLKQNSYWIFVIAVIVGLILPNLIQDGMFVDGLFYTVVSKNLANGVGTFWFPYYSASGFGGLQTFHEHPPLVFGIQSVFFKIFGNGMYTERIYILFTLTVTFFLLYSIWIKVAGASNKNIGWLPILLWIITPIVFWSFTNNMQENTMGIFVLLSLLFYFFYLHNNSSIFFLLLSGAAIFLSSFSKGIPGLFPLAIPFIYWITTKKISIQKMFFQSFVLLGIVIMIYSCLLLIPAARESLSIYFFKRLLVRIEERPTVDSHLWILYRFAIEIVVPLSIALIVYLIFKIRAGFKPDRERVKLSLFFILLGSAGVVPLILTKVQRGFYFVPTIPLFAIGLALLVAQPIGELVSKTIRSQWNKIFTVVSVLLLTGAISFTTRMYGKKRCNEEMLNDIYLMGPHITNSDISIPHEMWDAYSFEGYFMRYFNRSMLDKTLTNYYVTPKTSLQPIPEGFTKIELPTLQYDLYYKKTISPKTL